MEQCIDARAMDAILMGATYSGTPGLSGPGDFSAYVSDLVYVASIFKTLHQGVYLGFSSFKQLPTDFGIRGIWDDPVLPIAVFHNDQSNISAPPTVNVSYMVCACTVHTTPNTSHPYYTQY